MNEKNAVNDTLSTLNSIINLINYSIQQTNNKNLRDQLVQSRNTLEDYQWQLYLIAKEKEYYIPAAPARDEDIEQVKNSL